MRLEKAIVSTGVQLSIRSCPRRYKSMASCHADLSLSFLNAADGTVLALLSVNDCLVAVKESSQIQLVVTSMSKFWEVNDLGEPDDFLGISIVHFSLLFISSY